MPIVDFEQDPSMPLGTGNFRDDRGRVMYLSDPETAARFIKTMPGSSFAKSVAAESEALATDAMGASAPAPAPDARLAQAAAGPQPDAPGAAPVTAASAADAPAPTTAPTTAPPAPASAPASVTAAPAAPGQPAAGEPAPGQPGAAATRLVSALDSVSAQLSARSMPERAPEGRTYDSSSLPLASVGEGETQSVKQGRSVKAVLEEIRDVESVAEAGDDIIRNYHRRVGRQNELAATAVRDEARRQYGINVTTAFEKNAERQNAEKQASLLKEALRKNDESLDPDRKMRAMSGGKKVALIILAALNGGFGSLVGQKSNGVVRVIDDAIERDIDRQKQEIASGRIRLGNDIDYWMKRGLSAELAEKVARDALIGNLAAFKDAEAKRINAVPEQLAQADLLIAPRLEQRAKDRALALRTAEDEVTRTSRADRLHARPEPVPGLSAQDVLAMINVSEKETEKKNAEVVSDAIGHPVSVGEANAIKDDTKEFAQKRANIEATRNNLRFLAEKLKLFKGPKGYEGDAQAGKRPFGTSALDDQAREIDRAYALLKRSDVMSMTREPSAKLQDEFARITERPFWDSDIPAQLNAIEHVLDAAEQQLRDGYGPDVTRYYDAVRTGGAQPPRQVTPAAAAPARPAAPATPSRAPAASRAPAPPPPPPPTPGRPRGGLRSEED